MLAAQSVPAANHAAWRTAIEGRRDWLAERGVRYVFGLAPNKPSIYPEMLPNHIRRRRGRTRMDRFKEYLEENLAWLEDGSCNLVHHINTVKKAGINPVVAINAFHRDTQAEIDLTRKMAECLI